MVAASTPVCSANTCTVRVSNCGICTLTQLERTRSMVCSIFEKSRIYWHCWVVIRNRSFRSTFVGHSDVRNGWDFRLSRGLLLRVCCGKYFRVWHRN